MQRIPDTFQDERAWASCFLPYVAEELCSSARGALGRLSDQQWACLTHRPFVSQNNGSWTCLLKFDLVGNGGYGRQGAQKPTIKRKDVVIVTNSKVRSCLRGFGACGWGL